MEEPLSKLSQTLISIFEKEPQASSERTIKVNPIVSKVVSWYEKFRTSMEYNEEEVIIRVSIERILRRRLLLGGRGENTAEPLIREMIWGGYFKDDTVPQSAIEQTKKTIDLHLSLRHEILKHHRFKESTLNEWFYQFMSADIEHILNPNIKGEAMGNLMFQVLRNHINIVDDSEEARDVQVFIAVRKSFHRDDLAFLRYHLFNQYFGKLDEKNLEAIAHNFAKGYKQINSSLTYPRKESIFNYAKKKAPIFFILEDFLRKEGKNAQQIIGNVEELQKTIFDLCSARYKTIKKKVRTAVMRSVIFIICTKLIFAFGVEGSYERLTYGKIIWTQLAINAGVPPLLMIIASLFIRTPGDANSKQIFSYIRNVLHDTPASVGSPMVLRIKKERKASLSNTIFTALWFLAFVISFGGVFYILSLLHFNLVSQLVFAFFLAVVSFLSYRISLTAHLYSVIEKQNLGTFIVDFLFMPIVRVGRQLAQSVQSINFLLYIFDFVIETPFKWVFAFFEQWFGFLHSKREELE